MRPEDILLNLGIAKPKDINLELIAFSQNAFIKHDHILGSEARIVGGENAAIITISEGLPRYRERFAIAHEIGHWNLDRGQSFFFSDDDNTLGFRNRSDSEIRANKFASELLLPTYMLTRVINKISELSWEIVFRVAERFEVSLIATALRLMDLGDFPAVFISVKEKRRAWFKRGPKLPESIWPHEEIEISIDHPYKLLETNIQYMPPRAYRYSEIFSNCKSVIEDIIFVEAIVLSSGESYLLVSFESEETLLKLEQRDYKWN
jgi:Zn-dependent peptidase ImmA (M78 family)